MTAFVYIVASRPRGALYIGSTERLVQRVWQHRNGEGAKFTRAYKTTSLVYFEIHADLEEALRRERRLKRWVRAWKVTLIEQANPGWKDLFEDAVRSGY